ncbi:MAG: sulfatase-like hydrolase/transferase [Vicinamibacterales bacterium]
MARKTRKRQSRNTPATPPADSPRAAAPEGDGEPGHRQGTGAATSGATGSRRLGLLLLVGAAVALGAWWFLRSSGMALPVDPDRNVLLVTIDTLRADALGSYGGRAQTPNLDRLAARGARFSFAHSHAVVTLTSHASILSGEYPYQHGLRDNTGYRFPADGRTMATRLKADGFATGAFIGAFPLDHQFGLDVGFDRYDDRLNLVPSGLEASERERRADVVVASALDWIGRQSGKWFTWVHVYDPHVAYAPPAEWAAKFPSDPYLGEVSWTDAALGPLFDQLASQPRPTLVIVTGDHGEGLGDHGELTHSVFAYESTLHIPLIVAEVGGASGRAAASGGVVVDSPVRHVDLLPTVLDAVGLPADPALPGSSLRPVLAGDRSDRPSYFEAMSSNLVRGWAPLRGVLVGHEKYIDLPIVELYDLAADPKELRNTASTARDRVEILRNTLRGFDMTPPGRPRQESAETIERLRSLGYIGGGAAAAREEYTEEDDPKRLIELEQMMTRAAEAYREGRPADAVSLYREVIDRRPDTEDAYRKLALIYWRAGQPRDAVDTLEAALQAGVTQSEVRIKLGQYLAESGQAAKAIELLEGTAGSDPDALVTLGNAYQAAGRTRDAMRTFQRLLDLDPASGLAHENIGIVHLQADDLTAAETSLRRAVDLDPSLAGAYTALGVVLARTNRRDEAIAAWTRATELDPQDFNALFNLTVNLADAGRLAEARAAGERFVATAPAALRQDVATIQRLLDQIRGR